AQHALAAQVLGKARAPPDGVVDGVFLHESAAALLDAHQAALLEFAHGAPDGVAVVRELGRQLGLGRQAFAGRVELVADLVRQQFTDLSPYRDTGASFDHGDNPFRNGSFMLDGHDCASVARLRGALWQLATVSSKIHAPMVYWPPFLSYHSASSRLDV